MKYSSELDIYTKILLKNGYIKTDKPITSKGVIRRLLYKDKHLVSLDFDENSNEIKNRHIVDYEIEVNLVMENIESEILIFNRNKKISDIII